MSDLFNQSELTQRLEMGLEHASRLGADQAELGISGSDGVSVNVRLGEVETIEKDRSQSMGITVYKNGAKGSASTTDLSEEAIKQAVESACSIARFTQADPCAGLADADRMATEQLDLGLNNPWDVSTESAIELAITCEQAALEKDTRITNSEGAAINTHQGVTVYGNSHGFIGSYQGTRHSVSCAVLGQDGGDMQRDYWYSVARHPEQLMAADEVGRRAAERTLARLNPRKLSTRQSPVLFSPEMARSLVGHFLGGIRGGALYRKASFLLDRQGDHLFPEFVRIHEQPHLPGALGSAAYDNEGVATTASDLVTQGQLMRYSLDSYSARRLGLTSTGNAGGSHNVTLDPGCHDFDALLAHMNTGLLVTELMGSGVNGVTGDYSRGAAGYWVENGVIQYPVAEITIAGNLLEMFQHIVSIGTDVNVDANIRTGSILLESMTIAGD